MATLDKGLQGAWTRLVKARLPDGLLRVRVELELDGAEGARVNNRDQGDHGQRDSRRNDHRLRMGGGNPSGRVSLTVVRSIKGRWRGQPWPACERLRVSLPETIHRHNPQAPSATSTLHITA